MTLSKNAAPTPFARRRVSRATLYRLLKEGKITSIKIGTRRLIRDDQINALLAGGA
jgi:excisionase family DNA binding protein